MLVAGSRYDPLLTLLIQLSHALAQDLLLACIGPGYCIYGRKTVYACLLCISLKQNQYHNFVPVNKSAPEGMREVLTPHLKKQRHEGK